MSNYFICEDGSTIAIWRIISIFPTSQKSYYPGPMLPWTVRLGYKCAVEHLISDADHERLLQFAKYKFSLGPGCPFDNNVGVVIRAHINGKYFCADDAGRPESRPIVANRDIASEWERFTTSVNSDYSLSLKSNVNGKYLSARVDDGGRLTVEADKINAWEKFLVYKHIFDNRYVLRSVANDKYVSVNPNTGSVCACADAPREWEWMSISLYGES